VKVGREAGDYNSHLVREAARVFREGLLPILLAHGPRTVLSNLAYRLGGLRPPLARRRALPSL